MNKPLIIAHRGASNLEHENTLKAFKKAIELGVDFIELDVRQTSDHVLVVFHDKSLASKKVNEASLEELKKFAAAQGFEVPTFEEALQFLSSQTRVLIEIKEIGNEQEIIRVARRFLSNEEFIIISLDDEALATVRKIDQNIKTGLILGQDKPEAWLRTRLAELYPAKRVKRLQPDYLIPHYRLFKYDILRGIRKINLPIFVWTVNEPSMIKKYLKLDYISGVITDCPEVATQIK